MILKRVLAMTFTKSGTYRPLLLCLRLLLLHDLGRHLPESASWSHFGPVLRVSHVPVVQHILALGVSAVARDGDGLVLFLFVSFRFVSFRWVGLGWM